MKSLLAASLLLTALQVHAVEQKEVVIVIGDSLSAPSYSWAEIIDDSGAAQIMNFSRNGLHLIDVTIPSWIGCKPGADKVVIWLGGNDALNTAEVPDATVAAKFRDMMALLTVRNCDIHVILPPHGAGAKFPSWEDRLNRKRGVIFGELWGKYPDSHMIDMPWNWSMTLDGLHQNKALHAIQAKFMTQRLGL